MGRAGGGSGGEARRRRGEERLPLTNESGRDRKSRRMSHRADTRAHVHVLVFWRAPSYYYNRKKKKKVGGRGCSGSVNSIGSQLRNSCEVLVEEAFFLGASVCVCV